MIDDGLMAYRRTAATGNVDHVETASDIALKVKSCFGVKHYGYDEFEDIESRSGLM